MDINKMVQVAKLRAMRSDLESKKTEMQRIVRSADASTQQKANSLIHQMDTQIAKINKAEESGVGIDDLISASLTVVKTAKELSLGQMPTIIQDFVKEHLNKKKTLIEASTPRFAIRYAILSVGVSFGVKLDAEMNGDATNNTVVINGSMTGSAYADASLGIGMSISLAGYDIDCELLGGARGTLTMTGRAKLTLGINSTNLSGNLAKTTIKTDFDIDLYVQIPEWVCDTYYYIPDVVLPSGWPSELPRRPSYNVGKWNLFNVIVPGYDATFNMSSKRFSGRVNGQFSYELGSDVKFLVKRIKSKMPFL